MFLLPTAVAATPALRFGYTFPEVREELIAEGEHLPSVHWLTVVDVELGLGARPNDSFALGGSIYLSFSESGGSSVGAFAAWAPLGWTKVSPLVELRVSLSEQSVSCDCIVQDDGFGLESWGAMAQLRPGVRFGFGERGWRLGVQGELRAAYRTVARLPSADGVYTGGVVGGILTLDVPLGRASPAALPEPP